jgi:hypothetical protein
VLLHGTMVRLEDLVASGLVDRLPDTIASSRSTGPASGTASGRATGCGRPMPRRR